MKKLLATFLCAVMVLTMAPASVFADSATVTTYVDFKYHIENAVDGDVITLGADIEIPAGETLYIEDDITIDGNGKTITATATRPIRVMGGTTVTIKNVTINGTERCIETRAGNIDLTLDNVNLKSPSQPFTVGGSGDNITVDITNSTIEAVGDAYAITVYNPVTMTISGSQISGWCILNMKLADGSLGSKGSDITLTDSILVTTNTHDADTNAFTAFMIEDDNITVTLNRCTVDIIGAGAQPQSLVGYGNELTATTPSNSKVVVNGGIISLEGNACFVLEKDSANDTVSNGNALTLALGTSVFRDNDPAEVPAAFMPADAEVNEDGQIVAKTPTTTPPAPEAEKKPETSPKTGDNSNMLPFAGIMVVAMMIMAGAVLTRRQTQR